MIEPKKAESITSDQYWVNLARDAHSGSSTWFDTNVRDRVILDIQQFQGEHPSGSKYYAEAYKLKSKMFRPKTRTAIRKNEATAAEAFFSTEDIVAIRPVDDDDPLHQASAKFHKALLQIRLTRPHPNGLPWFLTLMGGVQEALSIGTVCSYQDWKINPGKKIDRPDITLIPVENYRFDPAADWRDVVNTSPYFIVKWPMYLKDIRARMQAPSTVKETEAVKLTGHAENPQEEAAEAPARAKPWRFYEDGQIRSSAMTADTIRMAREKGTDSKETATLSEFSIAWVHENFIETEAGDVVYYTLGTEHLLSDPVPVTDKYPQGRPVVVGFSVVEAHKPYKSSIPSMTRDIQGEVNDVANMRMDNVKLILNKRHLVKRGAQVDLRSLTRNVAGSVTLVNSINEDVKFITSDDATASSYQEQDRLNLDFDDMAGTFSGSSVASNSNLNRTLGGLDLVAGNTDKVSAYQLRTIAETWVEPVLRQVIILEQFLETDSTILAEAAKAAEIDLALLTDDYIDEMLRKDTILNVSVGTGSSSPQLKVERFSFAMKTLAGILGPDLLKRVNEEEIIKELFGNLGYKDGARFFKKDEEGAEDPKLTQAMEMVQKLQAALALKSPPEVVAAQVAKLEAETRKIDVDAIDARVKALFAAMNTAQTAVQVPGITPIADAIAKSAGFVDQDAPPIYPDGIQPQAIPAGARIPQNSSPTFPGTADRGVMSGIEGGQPEGVA